MGPGNADLIDVYTAITNLYIKQTALLVRLLLLLIHQSVVGAVDDLVKFTKAVVDFMLHFHHFKHISKLGLAFGFPQLLFFNYWQDIFKDS